MKNAEIAQIFNNIADILELKGENVFRIRAYRRAAGTIEGTKDIDSYMDEKDPSELPGIGKDLAGKIREYLKTERIDYYEELKRAVPKALLELMEIPGIGPKTAGTLCDKLKIQGIADLKKKAKEGKIRGIAGIKEKTVENILRGIDFLQRSEERMLLGNAVALSDDIIGKLKGLAEVKKISPAGSLRRMKETVRDIDILITSDKPGHVMKAFTGTAHTKDILAQGPTKASIITRNKVQVDCRVVPPGDFGSALLYFTGSKEHNVKLRKIAIHRGLKLNEYGLFRARTDRKVTCAEEKDIYRALGMDYIPPELREDRGEIEAAKGGTLPRLVELKDIRGDLHVHSDRSDGYMTFEEIKEECGKRGYEYAVITDHSKSLRIAGGLKEKDLMRNAERVRKLNKKRISGGKKDTKLLIGAEVDILSDGTLDYGDDILKELDFVIAAIHTGFKQPGRKITDRITRAMENRYVNMVAHPTGRLLGTRDAYEVDIERVLVSAKETGTVLEINAHPERLDLDDMASRKAKDLGVKLAVATDSHRPEQFGNMIFGVGVARRGWLEKKDILNCLGLEDLLKRIRK